MFICQRSINEREKVETENLKTPKGFVDYSQKVDDVYENLEDNNPTKKENVNSVRWYDSRYGI